MVSAIAADAARCDFAAFRWSLHHPFGSCAASGATDERTSGAAAAERASASAMLSREPIKCPVCSKRFRDASAADAHLVECERRLCAGYNGVPRGGGRARCRSRAHRCSGTATDETLLHDMGRECVICFEELVAGDCVARLPCLCLYHKQCAACAPARRRGALIRHAAADRNQVYRYVVSA